ncbi:MAG: hypothetical protein ACK47B_21100 [Armatimonadota bacterium]
MIAHSVATTAQSVGDGLRGIDVYRVWGNKSHPYGRSWTRVNPSDVKNYRDSAGLPDVNSGEYISHGRIIDPSGIEITGASPLDGNAGGLDELIVPNSVKQIELIGVHMPDNAL